MKRESTLQVRVYNRSSNMTYILEQRTDKHRGLKHHTVQVMIDDSLYEFVLPIPYLYNKND